MNIDWSKALEGWKLVPIRPTPDMRSAAGKLELETIRARGQFYAGDSWAPMIAASPEYKPLVAPWNGEGLPPVGTICEFLSGDHWFEVEVKYSSDWLTVIKCLKSQEGSVIEHKDVELSLESYRLDKKLRPLRTPEQIAAEDRLHKIRNACTDISRTLDYLKGDIPGAAVARTVIEAMIDAGYRKQEQTK